MSFMLVRFTKFQVSMTSRQDANEHATHADFIMLKTRPQCRLYYAARCLQRPTMSSILPNELAYAVADKCRSWTFSSYTADPDTSDVPRQNSALETAYETRLDRTITETQTKIQSQKRVLDDVPSPNTSPSQPL